MPDLLSGMQWNKMFPNVPSLLTAHPQKGNNLHPNVPECSQMFPPRQSRRNEPTETPEVRKPRLSYTQRAGARLMAQGNRVGRIAMHLGVTRHTITRWKHDPDFLAAIESARVQTLVMRPDASPPAPRTASRKPTRPNTPKENRECEQMINQILSKARR